MRTIAESQLCEIMYSIANYFIY